MLSREIVGGQRRVVVVASHGEGPELPGHPKNARGVGPFANDIAQQDQRVAVVFVFVKTDLAQEVAEVVGAAVDVSDEDEAAATAIGSPSAAALLGRSSSSSSSSS